MILMFLLTASQTNFNDLIPVTFIWVYIVTFISKGVQSKFVYFIFSNVIPVCSSY